MCCSIMWHSMFTCFLYQTFFLAWHWCRLISNLSPNIIHFQAIQLIYLPRKYDNINSHFEEQNWPSIQYRYLFTIDFNINKKFFVFMFLIEKKKWNHEKNNCLLFRSCSIKCISNRIRTLFLWLCFFYFGP